MRRAYPRHSVNLSPQCYAALPGPVFSGKVLKGGKTEAFERKFADFIGVPHALGTSSGRAALYLAFNALGFEAGDEIIMRPTPSTSCPW